MNRQISVAVKGALLLLIFGSTGAGAATVTGESGKVQINSGSGFATVAATTEVPPGAQVLVGQGGSALITYASNCAVRVASGVWSVQAASPCPQGTSLIDFGTRMNEEAPPPQEPSDSTNTTMLIVGGVAIAGGVTAAVLLSQNNHNDSSSSSNSGSSGSGQPGGTNLPASP